MNKKIFGAILFLIGLLVSSAVSALPVTIETVKVDGDALSTTDLNRVKERGDLVDVKVLLSSSEDLNDVEVDVFVPGYEHGTLSDNEYLDMKKDSTYTKSFSLRLPDRMEKDNYDLKVLVTARGTNDELIQSYKLSVDPKRHSVVIKDVITSPEDSVVSGRSLLATVRVKNVGNKDEDDIKVTVSIPELGVSASDYIDELKSDKSTSSEELYLRVPDCAKAGEYTLKAVVSYDDGDESAVENIPLTVVESETCEAVAPSVEGKTTITYSAESQSLVQGAAGAVYPITLTNEGTSTKTYTLSLEGVEWAATRISPSQVISLKGGETKTAYLYVSANEDAAVGSRVFAVSVSDQAGNVLKQLTLNANVDAGKADLSGARRALEVALVALIVVLVIIGLVVAFTKVKGRGEEGESGQTYY